MQHYLPEYQKVSAELLCSKNPGFYMLQRIIGCRGNIHIHELSEEMAFSLRHTNELFRNAYGISPKEFEKIVRFQNILIQLEKSKRIVDAAIAAGYYDQSHLLKEFRSLVGVTPKMYIRKKHLLMEKNPLFLEQMPILQQNSCVS